jgi:GNAT superfamily N-acetyltransferase
MTRAIEIREFAAGDVVAIAEIDRSEFIDGQYRVEGGALSLVRVEIDSLGWSPADVAAYVARARGALEAGGRGMAAWAGDRLVGVATLHAAGVGGDPSLLLLDMLYVSRESRGHGIGRALLERIAAVAHELGATALYISATPTRTTVEAYLHMGAVVVDEPDAALFELEPDDIHLRLDLARLAPPA